MVWGCRANDSVIPGPEKGLNKFEWFSQRFNNQNNKIVVNEEEDNNGGSLLPVAYQWRLNLRTGEVKEKCLIHQSIFMDFPFINLRFTGLPNKFGYAQLLHSSASSNSGILRRFVV